MNSQWCNTGYGFNNRCVWWGKKQTSNLFSNSSMMAPCNSFFFLRLYSVLIVTRIGRCSPNELYHSYELLSQSLHGSLTRSCVLKFKRNLNSIIRTLSSLPSNSNSHFFTRYTERSSEDPYFAKCFERQCNNSTLRWSSNRVSAREIIKK